MSETTKETITTTDNANSPSVAARDESKASSYQTVGYLVYLFFGVLEIFLVFRLVLKLTGANPTSGFVSLIYSLTGPFTSPFAGIFHSALSQGVETTAVLEPATLVGIVVFAFLAWGITQLVVILSGKKQ